MKKGITETEQRTGQHHTEVPEQKTVRLGLKKSSAHPVPDSAPVSVSPEPETTDDQATVAMGDIPQDEVVPAPRGVAVQSKPARRSLRKTKLSKIRSKDVFDRAEYFIDFLSQNLSIIESMSYLDGYRFVTLVAHELRFTHLQMLEVLEKFQSQEQVLPLFQILIPLYETYYNSRNVSAVQQLRQMYAALVRIFEAPALRNQTARLEVLEITAKIFNLSRGQFFQLRSEFLD